MAHSWPNCQSTTTAIYCTTAIRPTATAPSGRFKTFTFLLYSCLFCWLCSSAGSPAAAWTTQGANVYSNRAATGTTMDSATIDLASSPLLQLYVGASTSATPAMIDGTAYAPSWDGSLRAWDYRTGWIKWQLDLGIAYYGKTVPGIVVARTTPVFWKHRYFLLGTYTNNTFPGRYTGIADMLLIDSLTGALLWKYTVDHHIAAAILCSGNVDQHKNVFYGGVSSVESELAADPTYPCCSFVGSAFALKLSTAAPELAWQTYTIDRDLVGVGKLSGGAIWGSSPSISKRLNLVFYGTGQNYQAPQEYIDCLLVKPAELCNQIFGYLDSNWIDSVLALNTITGAIVWGRRMTPYDAWNVACIIDPDNPNCPQIIGLDADFGMAPTLDCMCAQDLYEGDENPYYLITEKSYRCTVAEMDQRPQDHEHCFQVIYAGQKNGNAYAWKADDGEMLWANAAVPGGIRGGFSWGLALDASNIYLSVINSDHQQWILHNCSSTLGGGWIALSKLDGQIVWTTSDPANYDPSGGPFDPASNGRTTIASGTGAPALVNDILLVCSTDGVYVPDLGTGFPTYGSGGYCYELDKHTGKILSSRSTGGSVYGGFAIADDCACVGSGYARFGFTPSYFIDCWCTETNFTR